MDTIQKTTPNYARYTIAELEDVLVNIDRVKYAQRYEDAKAMLAKKLQERPSRSETEQAVEEAALPPVKWSEMHKVTHFVLVALLVQIFTSVPFVLIEFMAAKDWLQHTSAWYWSLTGLFSVLWFTSLIKDKKFSRHLVRNWSGKMAAAIMPLLFLMFSYITMDNTIPLILHNLNAPQQVSYSMPYRKAPSSKRCRYKVEIIETPELESGRLCMSPSERDSLPETGHIVVIGSRSQFGLVIDGFLPI